MKVTRKQEKIVQRTLEGWRQEGVIDAAEQQRLQQNLSVQLFDWQRMSRYAFWVALACAIIAIGSLVADEYLMELLFNFGYVTRAIILLLISLAFYFWGFYRQKQTPDKRYSNEAILFLGVLFTALFLWQLGMALDNGSGNAAPLLLFGCVIYGVIGYLGRSGLIWIFCLLALGSYFGTSTGYASGWGAYWLGMNYPIRFVLFGGVLLAACYLLKKPLQQRNVFAVSKAMGLLYLFIALWILSIFGNYDFDIWQSVRQIELLHWSLLFALAAGACIWISLKTDDGMLRGFGLTFLGINLYTRYFEMFWDGTNKVIFFLLLAISLALVGRYAEKIWRLGEK
ncbi:hypothetical protein M975_1389 [Buttiauxella brennerae ATCC 51605]|uniref:DUF2157 domain-containing protein n=1 Tax=Buttiauxella brennerae ATCC 51605 TaxID=1354251 RepID=A0A1B7IT06_9ENTR|nr:DUF2157 domain-containing protein [Buttiauxella brennerae]OAT32950.1 hypothetical protein M975_1389 [Buttiauxella brennerae ATCC 51605]